MGRPAANQARARSSTGDGAHVPSNFIGERAAAFPVTPSESEHHGYHHRSAFDHLGRGRRPLPPRSTARLRHRPGRLGAWAAQAPRELRLPDHGSRRSRPGGAPAPAGAAHRRTDRGRDGLPGRGRARTRDPCPQPNSRGGRSAVHFGGQLRARMPARPAGMDPGLGTDGLHRRGAPPASAGNPRRSTSWAPSSPRPATTLPGPCTRRPRPREGRGTPPG